jgi:hypothetical protein
LQKIKVLENFSRLFYRLRPHETVVSRRRQLHQAPFRNPVTMRQTFFSASQMLLVRRCEVFFLARMYNIRLQ